MINLTVSEAHIYYVGRQEALVHNASTDCGEWTKLNSSMPKEFPVPQKGISGTSPFKEVPFELKGANGGNIYLTHHTLVTMRKRGWDLNKVLDTINNPVTTRATRDFISTISGVSESGAATIYFAQNGSAVVVNNATRQVIQVTKPGYKF